MTMLQFTVTYNKKRFDYMYMRHEYTGHGCLIDCVQFCFVS